LRDLEALHRRIQDGAFRESPSENRQKLFELLKTMERQASTTPTPAAAQVHRSA
jgi:hypothetical protein